jgi:hypothetical protein
VSDATELFDDRWHGGGDDRRIDGVEEVATEHAERDESATPTPMLRQTRASASLPLSDVFVPAVADQVVARDEGTVARPGCSRLTNHPLERQWVLQEECHRLFTTRANERNSVDRDVQGAP